MRWDTQRERLRKLDRVLESIERDSGNDVVIMVEGKRDEEALTHLGVESPVVRVSGNGRSLTETVDRVSLQYDEAIVLTDWDSQGDTLSVKLKSLLESHGVVPRTQHRRRLRHLTSKDIHDVESLASHRHNIESEL